jgi:WD40 repeat protein/serine/threonine protein kinase
MLKCPHCGARIKGPDLLTGVCSACEQRLSTSLDSAQASFVEPDQTMLSDEGSDSAPEGSSLEMSDDGSPAKPQHAALGEAFGHGFDVVSPLPKPAADGPRDRETGTAPTPAGATAAAADDDYAGGRTYVSDEFGDESATVESAEIAAALSAVPDDDANRTWVSHEIDPGNDPEAGMKTVGMDGFPADAEAGMKTIGMDEVAAHGDADKTFVSEDFGSLQGDGDATFVSDEVPEALVRTVHSEWGEVQDGEKAQATVKGRDHGKIKGNKSTLVIKTKSLRDVKILPSSTPGAEPEYELLKVLGEGGMGVVYDARQTSIDRSVALKMIKGTAAESDKQQAKFLAEAVVTGDLDHPNIVPIYDVGRNDQGNLFYSMKKVVGTPWDKAIAKKTLPENLEVLMKVADAIAFAHARGVVHRDLKPENTMLGEFGEVLVMDWGLAQPSKTFRKSASITETSSMGGTPAYMAPEMATGPLEKITQLSDVYLLGAMLYEIVTGKPPHTGKNAMKCLMAAARNEITPTDKTGELVDIARKALATNPADRYPSVRAFQAAVRDYQSHTESISMSVRAAEDLVEAKRSDAYPDYAKALFGFQEAHSLWSDNPRALPGVSEASQAYAESALRKGDFDLGLSLLDKENAEHQPLRAKLETERREREARKSRLVVLKRMAAGLVAAVFVVVTAAFFLVNEEKKKVEVARDAAVESQKKEEKAKVEAVAAKVEAVAAKEVADTERQKAVVAQQQTEVARVEAVKQKEVAEEERQKADAERQKALLAQKEEEKAKVEAVKQKEAALLAQKQEEVAKVEAVKQKEAAEVQRMKAELAQKEEEKAKVEAVKQKEVAEEAKRKEEYEAYIAQIGLAAAKIGENAFDSARELLLNCKPELRNWEWGRLMHLCSQSARTFDAKAPLDALAVSADGKWFATGGWDGAARIWNRETGQVRHVLKHGGLYVHSVAFSADGKWLATGGDDPQGYAQVWDVETGARVKTFSGHEDSVLSVAFSRDGGKLLTASYDKTARLWDVAAAKELKVFRGHTWWVWQAAFSPSEDRVVTVGQDGTAIVWEVEGDRRSPPFIGHLGPVYCAAFSPDGKTVVTGGYDRKLLAWQPAELQPFIFRNLEKGTGVAPTAKFRELAAHATLVSSVGFSPDGQLLLSSSQDNTVRLWDFAAGTVLQTFRGHDSWVRQAVFVPDGRTLLSASHDDTVREWSIAGYEELRSLQGRRLSGHADAVLAAAFSPDQLSVVTASRDRTARVWDARTGAERVVLEEGHSFLASTALFFDGGRKLITAAVDNTARVWDVTTGTQLQRFDRTGRAAAAAISPDQKWLLTGGAEKQAQLWDLSTGERVQSYPDHKGEVTAVAFSADGSQVVTGDAKGNAVLWNRATAERLKDFKGHTRRIAGIAFSPSGERLLTASGDKTVATWDIATGKELTASTLKHPDGVLALAVTADGKRAVTSCGDQRVRVWNLETAQEEHAFGPFSGLVYSLMLSADGARLLTAHAEERVVRQWDLAQGRELQIPGPDGKLGPVVDLARTGGLLWAVAFAPGHDVLTVGGSDARLWDLKTGRERMSFSPHGAVASARFSPDGQWVVTGSWDNSAKVWDVQTGRAILKLEGGHDGFVNSAVFSPDGRYVLTAGDDGAAVLWDVRPPGQDAVNAQPVIARTIRAHADRVRFAAFSRDGEWIVTASSDKTAKLWNAATGELVRTFSGHAWSVLSADFSKDGLRLITGSEDNSAKVWDVATGDCLLTLAGHTAPVASVAFAPDGMRVLTGSQDQAAKLWDAATGKEILSLARHTEDVTSVSFSPDGKQVLTGSRDGTAVIWLAVDWKMDAEVVTLSKRAER